MKVGDLVRVNTKYHGVKVGIVAKREENGYGWFIKPFDHPRWITAVRGDMEIINESR
tara:strand:- start:749 stop:919 length:171 start_codon:yes stop_codon:yes gene_type:complete